MINVKDFFRSTLLDVCFLLFFHFPFMFSCTRFQDERGTMTLNYLCVFSMTQYIFLLRNYIYIYIYIYVYMCFLLLVCWLWLWLWLWLIGRVLYNFIFRNCSFIVLVFLPSIVVSCFGINIYIIFHIYLYRLKGYNKDKTMNVIVANIEITFIIVIMHYLSLLIKH